MKKGLLRYSHNEPINRATPSSLSLMSDDEEEFMIKLSPSGSVLMAAPNPYNKVERIRDANEALKSEKASFVGKQPNTRVRFVEPSDADDDEFPKARRSYDRPAIVSGGKRPSKTLFVNVPTGYSHESEETLTDEEYDNDLEYIHDDFRLLKTGSAERPEDPRLPELGSSEEEVEDLTLPPTDESFNSSTETVICRSEIEESELTESFTKSINLSSENGTVTDSSPNDIACKESKSISWDGSCMNGNESLKKSEFNEIVLLRTPVINNLRPSTAQSRKTRPPLLKSYKTEECIDEKPFYIEAKFDKTIKRNISFGPRPCTAPAKRACCKIGLVTKLPSYSGLRSEYGLSKEQLHEREKKKYDITRVLQIEKDKRYLEEKKKQMDNEIKFKNWLIKKKRESEVKTLRRLKQSNYCFRAQPAPTAHLDKIGVLRKKILKRENTSFLLNEIFRNTKPQEQKTFRIYLGLCVE